MLASPQSLISSQVQLQSQLSDHTCISVYVYAYRGLESKHYAGLAQCRAESKADSAQQEEVKFPQRSDQGPVWTGRDFCLAAPSM